MKLIRGEHIPQLADKVLHHYDILYCDPNSIKDGETIYCDTHQILRHKDILNTKKNLTIITHNSDHFLCDGYDNNQNAVNVHQLTCWERWYGQNSFSKSVIPIPIGFENVRWEAMHGPKTMWIKQARDVDMVPTKKVYLNCNKNTSLDARQHCYNIASQMEYITVDQPNLTYQQYLSKIQEHKFVLSPRGNGLDCHRTWEVLMLRRIPVIKREGSMEQLYKNMPVLFIDDWHDLNQINLDEVYDKFFFDNQDYLTLNYWKKQIKKR